MEMKNWSSKTIVEEIIEQCSSKNLTIANKELVSFIVNLCPESEWKSKYNEDDSSGIIKRIIKQLLEKNASILTFEMQNLFKKNYNNRSEIVKKFRQQLEKKLLPIITEICETTRVTTDTDIVKLYQKILIIITLMSGLGNPVNPGVLKEATMTLQSVYLPSEVTHFVNLPRKAKDKQLIELTSIVGGIRIFNKDCRHGGQGIDDLPSILRENYDKIKISIYELLEDLMKSVNYLSTAVESFMNNSLYADTQEKENDDFTRVIEILTACRQQEIYVRKLLADVDASEVEFKHLIRCLQARLTNLHETVKFRTAIPIVQVYPQFIDLANIWMHLQDQAVISKHLQSFLSQLKNLNINKHVNIFGDEKLGQFVNDTEILSDADRLEKSMGQLISECGDCSILSYTNAVNNSEKMNFEFLGFCAWTFIACHGALIPGNPNIGVVKWHTKYFAFSSDEAAKKFGENPNKYYYKALNFVRLHPQYINLFHLNEEIEIMNNQEKSLANTYSVKFHHDQKNETNDFYNSYIDPDYHHSLWNHRKNVLNLINVFQCRTKSTQTNLSYFKKNINIQVSTPKHKSVQTHQDGKCNTISEKNYFWGLRGIRNYKSRIHTYAVDF